MRKRAALSLSLFLASFFFLSLHFYKFIGSMPGRGFAGLGLVEGSSRVPPRIDPWVVSRVRWTPACKWIRRIFRWPPLVNISLITRWLSIYFFDYDNNNNISSMNCWARDPRKPWFVISIICFLLFIVIIIIIICSNSLLQNFLQFLVRRFFFFVFNFN